MKLTFSGHDTFHCRQFWLKKAVDFSNSGGGFNDLDASLHLGVGKNMVTAIRFWAKCFGVLNEDSNVTNIGNSVFAENGWDPYLEDYGTLWLLQYFIVSKGIASSYNVIFNELIKERPEFTAEVFVQFVNSRKEGEYNSNT